MRVVNILGEQYKVDMMLSSQDPKLKEVCGYCDSSEKLIVITDMLNEPEDIMDVGDKEEVMRTVLRHEIVHAMLDESGLKENSDWARNEEMVDWIAIQFPKLMKAFREVNAI